MHTSTFTNNNETVYVYEFKCVNSCGKPAVLKSYFGNVSDDGQSECNECRNARLAAHRRVWEQSTCG